ncbi:hypothetical protein I203_107450 [Kwoniella mangroviensis CBS 8507]|uniref:hypothetical protein n=1 Tax=Kwoniella mangroviensis CBS 8507 TaxID=1296122 RepID=UPI00080D5383|nr:uncharacterized protein I203_02203 [Kwoniella mangroviensis CBS 8507]OCF68812.1 hypothetical protein I203_02203 [Kwoniella mangroviensis CBS 8507]
MWTHHGLVVLLTILTSITAHLGIAAPPNSSGNFHRNRRDIGSNDVIRGVNLGGWLLTEEWITPSIYTNGAEDEYHLCADLGKKKCLSRLEDHWKSFFTRDDFEEIKAAGLNSVRIPIGYWAVDVRDDEPYVSGQNPYLIQAVNWASELGLTVLLDLHGAPGSQNGQDNSGLIGPVLFPTNTSNTERSISVLKNLTEEFAKDIYGSTVIGIELLNEPRLSNNFSMSQLKEFYSDAAEVISGVDGNMNVFMHDAFWGPQYWSDYNPLSNSTSSNSNNFIIDTHQYYAFEPLNNLAHNVILEKVCNISKLLKNRELGILPTLVGEWSLETGHSPNSSSSSIQNKDDSREKRTWFRLFFEAQLAAYSPDSNSVGDQPSRGWYYWTWKTDYDIDTWSYKRGVAQGYIPKDVSNSSTLVFPILDNGCVDSSYNYTAPKNPGSGAIRHCPSGLLAVSMVIVTISFFCIL